GSNVIEPGCACATPGSANTVIAVSPNASTNSRLRMSPSRFVRPGRTLPRIASLGVSISPVVCRLAGVGGPRPHLEREVVLAVAPRVAREVRFHRRGRIRAPLRRNAEADDLAFVVHE